MSEQNLVPMTITSNDIRDRIYTIRGMQVMLDSDLAAIYGYETKNFNRQVRNNIEKFPEDMMFRLTKNELDLILRCKKSTSSWGGTRYLPYAFTEQGIYMLMTVLKGELAIKQSLALVRAFKSMRDYLADNAIIFFKGQMWDATSCIEEIIGKAKKSIILIDGYVDKGTLDMLSRRKDGVSVDIFTFKKNCKLTEKKISTFNSQYGKLEIRYTDEFHDRFLILDSKVLYHIGASIKDAGKKAFEISQNGDGKLLRSILERLQSPT